MWPFKNKHDSFFRRMAAAKTIGLVVGLGAAFWLTPAYLPEAASPMMQWGMVLWAVTFAAIIGLGGVVTDVYFGSKKIPFGNHFSRPFLRGGLMGAWLELMLVLLMHDYILELLAQIPEVSWSDHNLFVLAVVEGFVFGAIIDLIATKYGGEGKKIL